MRNFPHQVNQIPKLRNALRVAAEILERGEDLHDDGVYGYAVTRERIYTFRGLGDPTDEELEDRISEEQKKTPSNQGPRTFARDLRRTLKLLGFLGETSDGKWKVTDIGVRIIELPDPPNEESTALWRQALLNLSLVDSPGAASMHPTTNMLRLVERVPEIEKHWLAFIFDMENNSEEELNRITELATSATTFEEAIEAVDTTEYGAANAVKIIPSLLQQVRLLSIEATRCTLTTEGQRLLTGEHQPVIQATYPSVRRRRRPRKGFAVSSPEDVPERDRSPSDTRGMEDQIHTSLLINERTNEHQQLVKAVINALRHVSNLRCSDDAYDILASSSIRPEILLIEAKTVRRDGLAQARVALGQILYYEFFDALPMAEGRQILKIVAFNDEPGQDARTFLSHNGVSCLVVLPTGILVPREIEDYFPS